MASSTHIWAAFALVVGAMVPATSALAHPDDSTEPPAPAAAGESMNDAVLPASPTYQANGVTVDEHVGARVPADAAFRTQDGTRVTLGELIKGDLPTILSFNYSDCPMLCSLQLNGLTAVLPALVAPANGASSGFVLGKQYRIVTIDLEPNDTPAKLAKMRDRYIARLPEPQQAAARAGWTYLLAEKPGDAAMIARVAETVGFKYKFLPERAEYAHPAALIFLSTAGVVTRYVYGIEFDPAVMRESIFKAGLAEASTAVGFMNRCYHFDPEANSHARAGVLALRLGAVGFLVLLVSGFGVMHVVRRHRRAPGES